MIPKHGVHVESTEPALLIALPGGMYVSGVVTWATRLVNALAGRGVPCGLILHAQREGYAPISPRLDPRVEIFDLSHLGRIEECNGNIEPFAIAYADAALAMPSQRVVLSPNLHGDSYGAAAMALQELGRRLRVVGWCHLDSAYDVCVLSHYAPMLSRTVAVSSLLRERLAECRVPRLMEIPYGVGAAPARSAGAEANPFVPRILYAGRLDETTKRVLATVEMSDALSRSDCEHKLTIMGDGPYAEELNIRSRRAITRRDAELPEAMSRVFSGHDIFVLPSRAEGLSLAMLEAMLCGCIPVVTNVRSGPGQVIRSGENGILVDAPDNSSSAELGGLFADAVQSIVAMSPAKREAMRRCAVAAALPYSMEGHAASVHQMMRQVADEAAKRWSGPCAFTGSSGAIPSDAAVRLRAALESLAGERVVIHGTGRHTQELAGVIREFADRVIGFCDDDVSRVGHTTLDLPTYAPPGPSEATAVLVSSWIHEREILAKAPGLYRGLRIVGVYTAAAA